MAIKLTAACLMAMTISLTVAPASAASPRGFTPASGDCAPRGLSIDAKNAIDVKLVDISPKDGWFSHEERAVDVNEFWDKNGDGVVTETEFVSQQECRFGDTTLMSTFIATTAVLLGELSISNEDLLNLPGIAGNGSSVDEWNQGYVKIYHDFQEKGCTIRCLSDAEKAEAEARHMDNDNDNVIDTDGVKSYLTKFYDDNGDKYITKSEWVRAQTCLYGCSVAQAQFRWSLIKNFIGGRDIFDGTNTISAHIRSWSHLVKQEYNAFAIVHPNAEQERPCTGEGDYYVL